MRRLSIALAFSTLFLVSICSAQQVSPTAIPNLIRYGGTIKNAQGAAVSSATTGVTFAIYKQQDGGAPVWMETNNVTTDAEGNYSVLLGSTTATGLPSDLFSQEEQRWLGVQVQGQAEQPRVLLVSVPYAFKAHEAETLGGRSVSDFVLSNNASSSANAGNSTPAVTSTASNSSSTTSGIKIAAANQGPTNFSGSTTNQIVKVTQSGTGAGITASATTNAIYGLANGSSGNVYGVQGVATGTGGVALFGNANSPTGGTYGIKGSSSSTSGTGMRGLASAASGNTIGVSSQVNSPNGLAAVFNNAGGGKIISGQNNGVEKFSVDGSGNINSASGTYEIGGSNVVNIGRSADYDLFLGVGAGVSNIAGSGTGNTFSGYKAGYNNTTGNVNTFSGAEAGLSNTTGYHNTFSGALAGYFNTTGAYNTFSGAEAGYYNTTGAYNTFSGWGAGYYNTTGTANTFSGYEAGAYNTTALYNTFSGAYAGYYNTTGQQNTFSGFEAGYRNTSGTANTFSGLEAGAYNTTGQANTFSGAGAGFSNTMGGNNTFSGTGAGGSNTTGSSNTFFGSGAGTNNTTGSDDVYIANLGPVSGNESNTIRIGDPQFHPFTYIAGIYGSTSAAGVPVYINSDGLLGTQTSSLRFKEQVRDMGDSTSALMKLRPVTFLYKSEYANGQRTLQYGLIAEEVAKVYPELVAYDNDGQPYTVRYQYIATMLLNEVQKQYRRAETQAEVIKAQEQKIADLEERLSRLEKVVSTQVQTVAQK